MSVKMASTTDKNFKDCCEAVGTPATRRQYKKWQKKQGKAYTHFKGSQSTTK